MACADCDKAAERHRFDGAYWFRWRAADIGIIGCRKDVKEVMEALKKAQEGKEV